MPPAKKKTKTGPGGDSTPNTASAQAKQPTDNNNNNNNSNSNNKKNKKKVKDTFAGAARVVQPGLQRDRDTDKKKFPRGGGADEAQLLSAKEIRAIRKEAEAEADRDFAKEARSEGPRGKRAQKGRGGAAASDFDGTLATAVGETRQAVPLTLARVRVGTLVLGSILSVTDVDMIVSLPNGLTGRVTAREISQVYADRIEAAIHAPGGSGADDFPGLSEMYAVGDYVRCVVAEVTETAPKRIELSMRPSLVNAHVKSASIAAGYTLSVAVRSVEDHGYLVDTGIEGSSGFIKASEARAYLAARAALSGGGVTTGGSGADDAARLEVGAVVTCAVVQVAAGSRALSLTLDPEVVSGAVTDPAAAKSITAFTHECVLPGALVRCLVSSAGDSGIVVSFARGSFKGVVHRVHLEDPSDADMGRYEALVKRHARGWAAASAAPGGKGTKKGKKGKKGGKSKKDEGSDEDDDDDQNDNDNNNGDGRAETVGGVDPLLARVIHVDHERKLIGLSLRPSTVHATAPACLDVPVGEIFLDAKCVRTEAGLGAYFTVTRANGDDDDDMDSDSDSDSDGDDDDGGKKKNKKKKQKKQKKQQGKSEPVTHPAFCHVSRLADRHVPNVSAHAKIGRVYRCRVLAHSPCDDSLVVTLQPSVIDEPIMSAADLSPGQDVRAATVERVTDSGVFVRLAPRILGFIPLMHCSDAPVAKGSKPSLKRFTIRAKVGVRVWAVDHGRRGKVTVTAKRTLLTSPLPVVASIQQAKKVMEEGDGWTHAVVTGSAAYGVFVALYGGLIGMVPVAKCLGVSSTGKLSDDTFPRGQVIRVRITAVDDEGKLSLSMLEAKPRAADKTQKKTNSSSTTTNNKPAVGERFDFGTVHRARIVERVSDATFLVSLLPTDPSDESSEEDTSSSSSEEEDGTSDGDNDGKKTEGSKAKKPKRVPYAALLPVSQLADHASHAASLAKVLEPGHVLPSVMVLTPAGKNGAKTTIVTAKSTLIAKSAQVPRDLSGAEPGATVVGFVSGHAKYGVFVEFAAGFNALAAAKDVDDGRSIQAEDIESALASMYPKGQTVFAHVRSVEKGKAVLSLRPSLVGYESDAAAAVAHTSSRELLRAMSGAALPIGALVPCKVRSSSSKTGLILSIDAQKIPSGEQGGEAKGFKREALAVAAHVPGAAKSYAKGDAVTARVLDDEGSKKAVVDVSLLPDHVGGSSAAAAASGKKGSSKSKSRQGAVHKAGERVRLRVELVKDTHLIATVSDSTVSPAPLAIVPLAVFNGKQVDAAATFHAGQALGGTVVADHGGFVAVSLSGTGGQGGRGGGEGAASENGPSPALLDTSVENLDDIAPGMSITGRVIASAGTQINIFLGAAARGRVYATELADSPADLDPEGTAKAEDLVSRVAKSLGRGERKFRVVGVGKAREDGGMPTFELSLREAPQFDKGGYAVGAKVQGVVRSLGPSGTWLQLDRYHKAHLPLTLAGTTPEAIARFRKTCVADRIVEVEVVSDKDGFLTVAAVGAATRSRGVGDRVVARVTGVHPGQGLTVEVPQLVGQLGHTYGRVNITDISDVPRDDPLEGFEDGQLIECAIVDGVDGDGDGDGKDKSSSSSKGGKKDKKSAKGKRKRTDDSDDESDDGGDGRARAHRGGGGKITLSLRPSHLAGERRAPGEIVSAEDIPEGGLVDGYVKSTGPNGCFVWIGRDIVGRVLISELSDRYIRDVEAHFPPGKRVRARVISVTVPTAISNGKKNTAGAAGSPSPASTRSTKVALSLRESRVMESLLHWRDIEIGQSFRATVRSVTPFGVFFDLPGTSGLTGLAHISALGIGFVKDAATVLSDQFPVGKEVKVKVIRKREEGEKISLEVAGAAAGRSGRGGKGGNADDDDASDAEGDDDGDVVMVKKGKNKGSNKRKRGGSDEEGDESDSDEEESEESEGESEETSGERDSSDGEDDEDSEDDDDDDDDDESDDESDDEDASGSGSSSSSSASASGLDVPMVWDGDAAGLGESGRANDGPAGGADVDSDEDSDEDSDGSDGSDGSHSGDAAAKRRRRRQKKALKAERERALRERELTLASSDRPAPATVEDFERLVVETPNSSHAWLRYVAHLLSLASVDEARAVLERALERIDAREHEAERLNVWCAMLNLEDKFGTERSLMDAFKRACVHNDPKAMHLRLLAILEASEERAQLCEAVYRAACKKWPGSKKMHIRRARFKFQRGWAAGARKGLAEALRLLPKRKHIATLSAFAQLEFAHGEPERGRSIFESVVGEYPKRLDILRVYIDQEVKLVREGKGDARVARHLVNRSLALDVAPRKAKAMFKLALGFEREFGTEKTIDEVKRKAREFVENTTRGR